MIPKVVHQIWIGKRSLSPVNKNFMEGWKDFILQSGGSYVLWTNEKVSDSDIIPPDKKPYFDSDDYPIALKADLLRYEIIKKHGGIYVDVDFELLRPLSSSVWDCYFFGGIQNNDQVAIGIFGAEPNNYLVSKLSSEVVRNIDSQLGRGVPMNRVDQLTGPEFMNRICKRFRQAKGYVFYPPEVFYPYWCRELHRRNEDFRKTCPQAYAVHHWSGDWFENETHP